MSIPTSYIFLRRDKKIHGNTRNSGTGGGHEARHVCTRQSSRTMLFSSSPARLDFRRERMEWECVPDADLTSSHQILEASSVVATGRFSCRVAVISWKRGCAADAVSLYQFWVDDIPLPGWQAESTEPVVNSAANGARTQDPKILSQPPKPLSQHQANMWQ